MNARYRKGNRDKEIKAYSAKIIKLVSANFALKYHLLYLGNISQTIIQHLGCLGLDASEISAVLRHNLDACDMRLIDGLAYLRKDLNIDLINALDLLSDLLGCNH